MNNSNEDKPTNYVSVQEFYKEKNIFITGGEKKQLKIAENNFKNFLATGFVGKVLVEKLLRSCPDIDKIYVLVRSKKNKNIQDRIEDLVNVPLFDKLRESNPTALKKIIGIEGDIEKENLGISETDLKLLFENIGVVFHSAATIKFDEPLRVAAQINLIAVKDLIKLCKQMTKLEVIILS